MELPEIRFKTNSMVTPVDHCMEKGLQFKVLGPPVVGHDGLLWTPIQHPDEEDPTFFKTYLLRPVDPTETQQVSDSTNTQQFVVSKEFIAAACAFMGESLRVTAFNKERLESARIDFNIQLLMVLTENGL